MTSEGCEISGSGARCVIRVLGYENRAANNPSDANWLSCHVSVIGDDSLKVEGPATFRVEDFSDFSDELRSTLARNGGTASFHCDEEGLSVTIEVRTTGTAKVSGLVRVSGSVAATLSFVFETDQTFLETSQRQLEAITRAFPARLGSPAA